MGITHKDFLLKVFGFSVPRLCRHLLLPFPQLSTEQQLTPPPTHCHTRTRTHTHTRAHTHTLQQSGNLVLGFLATVPCAGQK